MIPAGDVGRALCDLLDFERPELHTVKSCADNKDYSGVLVAFRDRFISLAATLDFGELPGFWLWTATDAVDLLQKGIIATAQYGEFDRVSSYVVGAPGSADWNKVPDDGYDVVLRDIATMHWPGRLAEAYLAHADAAYFRAFMGYWDDFARNWFPAHQKLLHDKVAICRDRQPHVRRSIRWASESKLYFAWRLDNLFSWLQAGIAASSERAVDSLDPLQLATIVLHVENFEIPGAIRGLEAVGTPNQFVHCALGLLKTSLLLQDLTDGPGWTDSAIERMNWYAESGGYLDDGSDMEQSFNYNPGLIHALDSFLYLAALNPPLKGREFDWTSRFKQMRDYRERFLDALAMPDGRRPATGCDNTWKYSRDDAVSAYEHEQNDLAASGSRPSVGNIIRNHLLGAKSLPAPGFTSIYFPYGGWLAMRDGWSRASHYAFMKTSRPAPGHMREGGNGLAIAGFGRYLITNSGDDAYSDRGVFSRYFYSSVSQSTVSVDGYSQVLNDGREAPEYAKPIRARWHTSDRFDFAEGIFAGSYGSWNYRTGETAEAIIDDVRHLRQLVFLKSVGVWIVTDRITSQATHEFAQSWCLSPEFAQGEVIVNSDARSLTTTSTTGANIAQRFFSSAALTLSAHWGESDGTTALGWRALDWDEEQQRYTPAVDVLSGFHGSGDLVAVSLIIPSPSEPDRLVECVDRSDDGVVGFDARLSDRTRLTYLASNGGKLVHEGIRFDGHSLLCTTTPAGETGGLILGIEDAGGNEYEMHDGNLRPVCDIGVPTGFSWVESDGAPVPKYD